jgi:hypothetical protein
MKQFVTKRLLLAALLLVGGLLFSAGSLQAQTLGANAKKFDQITTWKTPAQATQILTQQETQLLSDLDNFSATSHEYVVYKLKAGYFADIRSEIEKGNSVKESIRIGTAELGMAAKTYDVASLLTMQESLDMFDQAIGLLKN